MGIEGRNKQIIFMKKFKFQTFLLAAMFMCLGFASCSDDDKDEPDSEDVTEIIGTWKCVESNFIDIDSDSEKGFEVGDAFVFFKSDFKAADHLISGKKCFVVDNNDNLSQYTEAKWDDMVSWDEGSQEFEEVYTLTGNKLTVMECDLDRYVGTISIKGNEMIYTYKYQNWNYDKKTMTSESKQYVAKFHKN